MALNLTFQTFEMPLRHPFTISRYTVTNQKTVIACVSDGVFSGYGEATANPYYNSTIERLSADLLKVKPVFESLPELHPKAMWAKMQPVLKANYFALCALDVAYWDFYARKSGKTLRSFWSSNTENLPLTSYTIAIDSLDVMRQKILEQPWPIYKIKLGAGHGLETVEKLREVTDSIFRIDANCAWTAEETISNSKILKDLNVEFIEQPLPADDLEGMRKVFAHSALPVLADESCQQESDVGKCAGLFHGINIKLMKCGGITPALRMVETARSHKLLLMAGCMTESTVGISGLVQLAPLLDYLDSDGSLLLREDIATGVGFDSGKIRYSEKPGTGAELHAFQ